MFPAICAFDRCIKVNSSYLSLLNQSLRKAALVLLSSSYSSSSTIVQRTSNISHHFHKSSSYVHSIHPSSKPSSLTSSANLRIPSIRSFSTASDTTSPTPYADMTTTLKSECNEHKQSKKCSNTRNTKHPFPSPSIETSLVLVCDCQENFRNRLLNWNRVVATARYVVRAAKVLDIPVLVSEHIVS